MKIKPKTLIPGLKKNQYKFNWNFFTVTLLYPKSYPIFVRKISLQ